MDSSIEFSPRHSTGWTGETPMSFDQYFSRLPTEIRLIIWRKNFFQPRVINIIPNTNYTQIVSRSQTPSFLHACLESRIEGLKFYETLGVPTYKFFVGDGWTLCPYEEQPMARVLINFETDTIFFGREMFANISAIELAVQGMHIQHQKVRKMGIHYSGCQVGNTFNDEILECHALEKLYMIFDDRPPSGRQSIVPGGDHLQEVEVGGKYCTEHNMIDWPPDKEKKLRETFTSVCK